MKPTLLLLLTAMSCVAQTNHMGLEPRPQMTYATNHFVLAESVLGTNRITNDLETSFPYFHVSNDYKLVIINSTNLVIKCTPGLSPIISKDTNGMWTVEFRKE